MQGLSSPQPTGWGASLQQQTCPGNLQPQSGPCNPQVHDFILVNTTRLPCQTEDTCWGVLRHTSHSIRSDELGTGRRFQPRSKTLWLSGHGSPGQRHHRLLTQILGGTAGCGFTHSWMTDPENGCPLLLSFQGTAPSETTFSPGMEAAECPTPSPQSWQIWLTGFCPPGYSQIWAQRRADDRKLGHQTLP